jgi:Tfp pilus assembly protein PilO
MWLPAIEKLKIVPWLRENGRPLRTVGIVFAILVCINLALYFIFIAPSAGRLKTAAATSAGLRMRHAEAVLFNEQKPLFADLLAGIPEQKDMPLLVKELEQMAKRLNLAVAAINYDIPKRESGELAMLSFSFPVEGRYPDIKRFIYEVETSGRLIGIQEVKLDSDKGRVKLQMKLMTTVRGN